MYRHVVSRTKILIVYIVGAAVTVALFVLIIGFRNDTALVGALTAAGTVAAAAFAAFAAMGSVRAAAESSAAARRSRETLARTMRPQILPSVSREGGQLLGRVQCGADRGAVEVNVAWILKNGSHVTDRSPRLEAWRVNVPNGAESSMTSDLGLPDSVNESEVISMVWIEYWDDRRLGHWRDTWQIDTEPHRQNIFVQLESALVD